MGDDPARGEYLMGSFGESLERRREARRKDPPPRFRELVRAIDAVARRPGALEVFRQHIRAVAGTRAETRQELVALKERLRSLHDSGQSPPEGLLDELRAAEAKLSGPRGAGEPLSLEEKYAYPGAVHDLFAAAERFEKIGPPEWEDDLTADWPERKADYFAAAAYDALANGFDDEHVTPDDSPEIDVLFRYLDDVKADLSAMKDVTSAPPSRHERPAAHGRGARALGKEGTGMDYAFAARVLLEIQAKCREWGKALRRNGWDTNKLAATKSPEAKAMEAVVMGLIGEHEELLTYCRTRFVPDPSTALDRAFDYIGMYFGRGPEAMEGVTGLPECLTVEVSDPKIAEPQREPTFIVQLGRWARKLGERSAATRGGALGGSSGGSESLVKDLQSWAGDLSGNDGGTWHWALVSQGFRSTFEGRIMSLVNRPGDAMTRQRLEAKYKEALAAVEEMDRLCTAPSLWTGNDSDGPPETDAVMAAEDSIKEVRRLVFELCAIITDGFATPAIAEPARAEGPAVAANGVKGRKREAGREEPVRETKPETDWRDVQGRLLRLLEAGEPFTSQRELAKRMSCSAATINKAVNSSARLRGWAARAKGSPKAQSLNEVTTDNTPSQREGDPADHVPDDGVDRVMALLIEQAEPAERARLNELDTDGRRTMATLYLEQQAEKHIEDEAPKGNRILGRKP